MVESDRPGRSTRRKSTKSYRVQDEYAFLDKDSDDSASVRSDGSAASEAAAEADEDGDVFMPEQQDEPDDQDDPDEFMDDEPFEEDSDASGETVERDRDDEVVEVGGTGALDKEAKIPFSRKPRQSRRQKNIERPVGVPVSAEAAGVGIRPVKPHAKSQGTRVSNNTGTDNLHARGVDDWARGGGMAVRLKDLFGTSNSDLTAVLTTRDRWSGQETLPSREENQLGRSYYVNEEAMAKQIQKTRGWYSSAGAERFEKGQRSRILAEEEAKAYLRNNGPETLNVMMGTVKEPKLYNLKQGSYMSTAEPFASKLYRRGWLLHLGAKIVDSQWTPNEEGHTQYLAVAAEQTPKAAHKPTENPKAPAFSATAQFPASIQIWAFESTDRGDLDATKEPHLALVICTDWGAPKSFRWSPISSADELEDGDRVHLGLLAGIWSDGKVRILDLSFPKPQDSANQTHYIHYSRAAFEIQLPSTIPSCLHWLSGVSLAVASSAGTLGVWTLTKPSTFPADTSTPYNPSPWFYRQLADTYILTLASGYPSLPSFISITSADGFGQLYDLRAPTADSVSTARGRIFASAQAWHEHTQAFLMPDENYFLRNNTVRRYYTNIYSMRVDSQITCCATSPVHPGTLIGCADGMVTASNPVIKVLNSKEVPWQQIWFTHEWRPPVDQLTLKIRQPDAELSGEVTQPPTQQSDSTQPPASSEAPQQEPIPVENTPSTSTSTSKPAPKVPPEILSQPLTRINEGYRIKPVNMQYYRPGKGNKDKETTEIIKFITIYEEPSAITSLAWNPNLKFGTWAVAGMGDGLVRVEDLGV